jgi:hypothetical protein
MRLVCVILAVVAMFAGENGLPRQTSSSSGAQTPAARPPGPTTYEEFIVATWKSLHDKILTMAKDTVFPEDKLGWKPHPDSRSMIDEYRHVTIGLEMSMAQIAGEKFDYIARMAADDAKPRTRASVVAEMEAAIAKSYPLVQKNPQPRLIFWIDHQAEHYGKLVSNYRMNGIVPPISRGRGAIGGGTANFGG